MSNIYMRNFHNGHYDTHFGMPYQYQQQSGSYTPGIPIVPYPIWSNFPPPTKTPRVPIPNIPLAPSPPLSHPIQPLQHTPAPPLRSILKPPRTNQKHKKQKSVSFTPGIRSPPTAAPGTYKYTDKPRPPRAVHPARAHPCLLRGTSTQHRAKGVSTAGRDAPPTTTTTTTTPPSSIPPQLDSWPQQLPKAPRRTEQQKCDSQTSTIRTPGGIVQRPQITTNTTGQVQAEQGRRPSSFPPQQRQHHANAAVTRGSSVTQTPPPPTPMASTLPRRLHEKRTAHPTNNTLSHQTRRSSESEDSNSSNTDPSIGESILSKKPKTPSVTSTVPGAGPGLTAKVKLMAEPVAEEKKEKAAAAAALESARSSVQALAREYDARNAWRRRGWVR